MGKSWSHLLVRPLARPLIGLGVTPNQITALHLVFGLATIGVMAVGSPGANLVAGFAWLFACLLDRVDGEVARAGDMCTPAGHRFDSFVDSTLSALYFLGLGVGLRGAPQPFGAIAVVCGALACLGQLGVNKVAEVFDGQSDDGKIVQGRWGFDSDDVFYLFGPLLWLPMSVRLGAVMLAVVGTGGFLLLFLQRLAGLKRRRAAQAMARPAE